MTSSRCDTVPGRSPSVFTFQPVIELRHNVSEGNVERRADDAQLQHGHFPMRCLDLGQHGLGDIEPGSKVSLLKPGLLPHRAQHGTQPLSITSRDEVIKGAFAFATKSGPIGSCHARSVQRRQGLSKLENRRMM